MIMARMPLQTVTMPAVVGVEGNVLRETKGMTAALPMLTAATLMPVLVYHKPAREVNG